MRRAILLAVLLVPAAALAKAPAKPQRVAVHPLRSLGLDADTVARLEDILRASVKQVPGVKEVPAARVRAAIDGKDGGVPLHCEGQAGCLAALGQRLHADLVIYGAVGGLGDRYTITLRAVSAKGGTVVRRASESVGGKREVLIDGITRTAYELLRPDLYVGSIRVKCPVAGAQVQVDGQDRGKTPLTRPITGLPPGRHALKILKTGYSDFDKFVEVRFQRTTVVTIDLAGSTVSGVIYQQMPAPPLVAASGPGAKAGKGASGKGSKGHEGDADRDDAGSGKTPSGGAAATAGLTPPPLAAIPAPSHALRWTGVGLLGAGAVAAGVGAYFGLQAQDTAKTLSTRFQQNGGPTAADAADWKTMTNQETVANALFVAGGVLAAVGGGALVFDLTRGPSAPPAAVSVLPVGPGGAGLTFTLRR